MKPNTVDTITIKQGTMLWKQNPWNNSYIFVKEQYDFIHVYRLEMKFYVGQLCRVLWFHHSASNWFQVWSILLLENNVYQIIVLISSLSSIHLRTSMLSSCLSSRTVPRKGQYHRSSPTEVVILLYVMHMTLHFLYISLGWGLISQFSPFPYFPIF